ncbi:hypothetical protein SEA_PHINKY_30 [Microbacterium phage Phinky]|nr:hypothetical protein SEA_PHINKY_30 [Microbacterium phage Phinky]
MCGCGAKRGSQNPLFTVKLPNGETKTYSSEVAANAKVQMTPGAKLVGANTPEGVSI